MQKSLRIAFLHPDLGFGGAERVIVDAALEMQARGHQVTIYTLHRDLSQCFEDARSGSLKVVVTGAPTSTLGARWRAAINIWRMAQLARETVEREPKTDVFFCDLVAHVIPILRRHQTARVLFYCHYPDRLLVHRSDPIYRMYRLPIDWAEERGLRRAHRVVVNSMFTAAAFHRAFPRLGINPELLYPGVGGEPCGQSATRDATPTVLCLNRLDPVKNLSLAIEAFAGLRSRVGDTLFSTARLVIAGSCDPRMPEQQVTLMQLRSLAARLGLDTKVDFRVSISDDERRDLLARATCFAYTPNEEHFGLGPVEAMAAGLPVVAVDSGGVRETVRPGETGFLCPPNADAFSDALASLILSPTRATEMGTAGRVHVARNFSRQAFGARLGTIIHELVNGQS